MQSVSFIVDGSSMSQLTLDRLSTIAKSLNTKDYMCEYVVYFDKKPTLESKPFVSLVTTINKNLKPIEKAISIACGQKLIFTHLNNMLNDNGKLLVEQASELSLDMLIPLKNKRRLSYKVGLKKIKNIGYVIATKEFAKKNADKFIDIKDAIQTANKYLSIQYSKDVIGNTQNVLVREIKIVTQYYRIAKRKYQHRRLERANERKRRQNEKLSRQVPIVNYSKNIPIFIICRDRVEPLKKLVKWCEDDRLRNIIFIDNASTYKPLLEYYDETPYEVIRLRTNIGHTSPWVSGAVDIYAKGQPYIVTDPDVIPSDDSHGAVKRFCELLSKYPERRKVGFGLKIDDLPDSYDLKNHVIAWEKQFWVSRVEDDVFDAEIDTTFALYRQNTPYVMGPGLRTGGNYVARHEPWYIDSSDLSGEYKYYREHADKVIGSWGVNGSELSDTYSGHSLKS